MTDAERWQLSRENVARADQEQIEARVAIEFDRLQAVERYAIAAEGAGRHSRAMREEMEAENSGTPV
jgi:hypothetical protein